MFEKIAQMISDYLKIDVNTITMESHVIKDLGFNSIDVVDLICKLEDTFGVEISDRDASKFQRVKDVVAFLEEHAK